MRGPGGQSVDSKKSISLKYDFKSTPQAKLVSLSTSKLEGLEAMKLPRGAATTANKAQLPASSFGTQGSATRLIAASISDAGCGGAIATAATATGSAATRRERDDDLDDLNSSWKNYYLLQKEKRAQHQQLFGNS